MPCIICDAPTAYYFSKTYTEAPFDTFMRDIGPVDYHKCTRCGFVLSKTHAELLPEVWGKLNSDCHHFIEDPSAEKKGNQPPYPEQALMLLLLSQNNLISTQPWLDYAAGYGTLSRLLQKYFYLHLPIFDPFVHGVDPHLYIQQPTPGAYETVINSAMFEHVLTRQDLDQVNALVSPTGCLILHTVICENIPKDPDWFYLRPPVHTAFHTNKSMAVLMQQWGYTSSLYCPKSKCWVLFKKDPAHVLATLRTLQDELQSSWFIFKEGFMDYWKGF
jgi:hypothetical protein